MSFRRRAMSTTATLDSSSLSLEAGAAASVRLTFRNDSEVVEEYSLRVVGPSQSWAEVAPDRVSLYPGQGTTALVEFRPPRSPSVHAGVFKFGVHVVPREHPDDAVVPEGTVEVLPFFEATGELMPRMSRGKLGAKHTVAIDNNGNVPITVDVAGSDPGALLEFSLQPPELTIVPGTVQFTGVQVRPGEKIWQGRPATYAFAVTATPSDGVPVQLDGTHVQDPVLPSRTIKAILFLLLLAVALTVGWHIVLDSVSESAPDSGASARYGAGISALPHGGQ
jgi:hypothetical protein